MELKRGEIYYLTFPYTLDPNNPILQYKRMF